MPPERSSRPSNARAIARCVVLSAIAGGAVVFGVGLAKAGATTPGPDVVLAALLAAGATAAVAWITISPLLRRMRLESETTDARSEQLRTQVERQQFEGQLTRALDMADTESDVLTVAEQALRVVDPNVASELLLADATTARLERVAARKGASDLPGCHVDLPQACPAIRGGRALTFSSSTDLDACPRLWGRADEPVAAVCIPVAVAGAPRGVLHSVTKASDPVDAEASARMEVVGARVGARIGLLRALEQSQLQAATDSLTGLMNRRTIEARTREMFLRGDRFSVAIADLDRFKQLNDTFGHQTGDQALRKFADVMQTALRPHDLVARYGGEEFLIVLPQTFAPAAVAAIERIRESLVLALTEGHIPGFTASFGLADSSMQTDFDELLRLADGALFEAKRRGRDRAVVANPDIVRTHSPWDAYGLGPEGLGPSGLGDITP